MQVVICGPNLRDQSKGDHHVHAAGCHDLVRHARREPAYREGWTIEAHDQKTVATAIYPPSDFQYDESDWRDYNGGVYYFPCCDSLPPVSVETHFDQVKMVSEADGEVLGDDEFDMDTLVGAMTETIGDAAMETLSTKELNDLMIAYLNGMVRGFTKSIESLKRDILIADRPDLKK